MVTEGRIRAKHFLTIQAGRLEDGLTVHLHTEDDAIKFFEPYLAAQVSFIINMTCKCSTKVHAHNWQSE